MTASHVSPASLMHPDRQWVRHASDGADSGSSPWTPMVQAFTWNVLAGMCADDTPRGFPYVSKRALDPLERHRLHMEELEMVPFDFIALQEVDEPQRFSDLFRRDKNSSVYVRREDSDLGLMLGWNTYYKLAGDDSHVLKFTEGGQIALIAEFEDPSGNEFVVATTHLKAKSDMVSQEMREAQSKELFDAIEEILIRKKPNVRVIVMGDFNTNRLSEPCERWCENYTHAYEGEATTFKTRQTITQRGEAPLYEVRQEDHIWHNGTTLSTLRLPSQQDFDKPYLPSSTFPSDHVCLGARLSF